MTEIKRMEAEIQALCRILARNALLMVTGQALCARSFMRIQEDTLVSDIEDQAVEWFVAIATKDRKRPTERLTFSFRRLAEVRVVEPLKTEGCFELVGTPIVQKVELITSAAPAAPTVTVSRLGLEVKASGLTPNVITYTTLLDACAKARAPLGSLIATALRRLVNSEAHECGGCCLPSAADTTLCTHDVWWTMLSHFEARHQFDFRASPFFYINFFPARQSAGSSKLTIRECGLFAAGQASCCARAARSGPR